ncbi:MAG: 5'-3' exonuclease H3TH domain-containing protein, partial [Propionibacteriaceae bacterium]
MSDTKTLLLIDGHSMAYRAFFGMPVENFATTSGQATNAVYGFTSMLINMLRDEQPTHVAVAFDVSRHSFRTDVYPEYKATRSASPAEFKGQVELIKQVLDALNIVHVEKPGFEADDLLATLSTQAAADGYTVRVCTGDRDALQLVTDHVTVLYPRKGVSDLVRMTPEAVEEKYQVVPSRYPELAALVGETSDNLPGVPGVGPKTAAKWLAQYDGLANLLAAAETVKGKAGEALVAHLDQVQRNRELNALVRNVELTITIAELERRDWDREAVHTLFDALEFKVLRDRLFESLPLSSAEPDLPEAGFTLTGDVLGAGEVGPWLEQHARGARTGVDVVGYWGSGEGDVVGIALASSDDAACWIDVAELWPADEAALAAWLGDIRFGKVFHDAKGPLLALWQRGWDVAGLECDT